MTSTEDRIYIIAVDLRQIHRDRYNGMFFREFYDSLRNQWTWEVGYEIKTSVGGVTRHSEQGSNISEAVRRLMIFTGDDQT